MTEPLVIRNDTPIIGWVFASLWFGFLVIFSWLFARDGGFHQFDYVLEVTLLSGFWLFGFAGLTPLLLTPRTRLTIADGSAHLIRRWLWRHREERLGPDILATALLITDRDSDGDPTYRLAITLTSGAILSLKESNNHAALEALRARLLA